MLPVAFAWRRQRKTIIFTSEITSERVGSTRSEWLSTAIRRQASATPLIHANFEAETFCIA